MFNADVPNQFIPEMIKEIAQATHIPDNQIIDLQSVFNKKIAEGKNEEIYFDCIHPSTAGYKLIAETVKAKIIDSKGELIDYNE